MILNSSCTLESLEGLSKLQMPGTLPDKLESLGLGPEHWYFLEACREGSGTPLQYSCLENPMNGGAW